MRTIVWILIYVFVSGGVYSFAGSGDFFVPDGKVGIGTTTPLNKLHIVGKFPQLLIQSDDSGNLGYEALFLGQTESATFSLTGWIGDTNGNGRELIVGASSTYPLVLYQNGAVRMAVNNSKVGIGTKSPNELLEVCGDGRAFFGDGGGYSRKGLLIDGVEGNTAARLEAYDYGSATGLNLVLNTYGHGNVGIGTTSPGYLLEVNGSAAKPDGGSWSNSSDERLKDITGAYKGGLGQILELRPVTFFYKEMNPRGLPTGEENIGFVAQEVQEVFPEAVSEGPDGYLDFNMHPVNVAMVNAIKELKAENDEIRSENEYLRVENASLKKDIEKIKAILGI